MPANAEQFIAQARTYKDVKWTHQGRSRATGIDCVGLVYCAAEDLALVENIAQQDCRDYRRSVNGERFIDFLDAALDKRPIPRMKPGFVLGFRDGPTACHVGILTDRAGVPHLLHAPVLVGKVIEEPLANHWPVLIRCWAVPGIDY